MAQPARNQRMTLARAIDAAENRDLLEAAVAAGALVAVADRKVRASEGWALRSALERMGEFRSLHTLEAMDAYRSHLRALETDPATGRRRVFELVGRLAGKERAGTLVLRVALAIAKGDQAVSDSEYAVLRELAGELGLDLEQLDL